MARTKSETKPERLAREVAKAVGAGVPWHLETVDFSDPNRPKTCLEVDFPILPINHIAAIEGNAGKPIYQMSKWWARRRSSVFRSMLIAAATKAPDDSSEAAKLVWDAYYGNHQKNEGFRKLKVADIFMGGGTTIVEGARLGMQMYGNDLNPVAWFVVKNELAQVDPKEVQRLLDRIEAEVKPQIMPFYACDCPRGHKGKWTQKTTGKVMGPDFDPLALTPNERPQYEYSGPEVIYTFWAKHGPCQATGCQHRTPIMSSPIIAVKTLTVKAWKDVECTKCGGTFDIEEQDARMAPGALFVVSPDESPYAIQDQHGHVTCPHCHNKLTNILSAKPKKKGVELTLLIHPDWLKGVEGKTEEGSTFGGSVGSSVSSDAAWFEARAKKLKCIEVRGTLPESIVISDSAKLLFTDERGGNVPRKSTFSCKQDTCGREQDILQSVTAFSTTAPASPYVYQGYCAQCDREGRPYGGRFFETCHNTESLIHAFDEWEREKTGSLARFWNQVPIRPGLETTVRTPLHKYQYKFWSDFFNPRQLLVHARLLSSILNAQGFSDSTRQVVLSVFQQYLRNQNMFCIWDIGYDKLAPFLSKNNLHPPARPVENGVFNKLGRGNWTSCAQTTLEAISWKADPWEVVSRENLRASHALVAEALGDSKSTKVFCADPPLSECKLSCTSSSDLTMHENESLDLVVTDPPFGDIMQYGELSGFFLSWLKPAMESLRPDIFNTDHAPTTLEAVENSQRHGKDSSAFYKKILTLCWSEAYRILKPGGILTFTFHHDKDGPWIAVLESLFDAGFYLEAAFPVRSDETKGEGSTPGTYGAQKVEYDIIHVCRKMVGEGQPISWARIRRQIISDVRQLREILAQHHNTGLQEADLQVIRRGKALEYYSRHYGKVYVERGREFPVKDALLAINQILNEESDVSIEAPPAHAEVYTRQFFRLFADRTNLARDQIQKFLRGTGVSPQEFVDRGWCAEQQRVYYAVSPLDWAKTWKGVARSVMSRDFDQAMFMAGACYDGSGIKLSDTLNRPTFVPHPATGDLLDWLIRHGGESKIKSAALIARQLFQTWLSKKENQEKLRQQQLQFGFDEAGE